MSERPQDWDKSRDEIISGEYVLGVLSELDRKRVEARIKTDPKFAMQVRRWQENLADFNDERDQKASSYRLSKPAPQTFELEAQPALRFWGELWNSVFLWRTLSAAALAGLIAVAVIDRSQPLAVPQPSKSLVAQLEGLNASINLVANYDVNSGRLMLLPTVMKKEKPQSLQVWVIEEGRAPLSIGVMPEAGRGEIVVSKLLRQNLGPGKIIAVTAEPLGGSPSGKPTGPVIAAGKAQLL